MMEILINIGNILCPIFYKVLYMSMVGTIIGILILILTKIFDAKLSAKAKCLMLVIPILFLVLPVNRIEVKTDTDVLISSAIDKVENTLTYPEKKLEQNSNYEKAFEQQNEKDKTPLETIQNGVAIAENQMNKTGNSVKNMMLYTILPILWLVGGTVGAIILILGNIRLLCKIHKTQSIRDDRMNQILMKCKKKLNIKKNIKVKLQDGNQSPCIYGMIQPTILLPKELLEKEDNMIENVFLHELSHYKRKDMITNCLLLIATCIHWFNPFVYRFFKEIRQEIELATDEVALRKMNGEEKKQYGRTLISLLEIYESKRVATKILCITDDNKNMEKRIRRIKRSSKLKKHKGLILVFVVIIVIGILLPFMVKPIMENQEKQNKIEGEWKPFKAEYNGADISLTQIYGTGISTYGGALTLKEDGTYTKFIGIYSEDIINDIQGKYEISDDNIYLTTNNGEVQNLKYIEDNNEILIREKIDDGTYVYFKKTDYLNERISTNEETDSAGIKAGEHTLQYGIYKSDIDEGKILGGTYELKSDGTFIYKNSWIPEEVNQEVIDDATGTYEVYYAEDKEKKTWMIQFNHETGSESGNIVAFDIIGDNQFSARQYGNTFTRVEDFF